MDVTMLPASQSTDRGIPAVTASLAAAPLLAQELIHTILDNVDDLQTLRACCISHSSLRPYAQERLFTTLEVDATPEHNNLLTLRDSFVETSLARHVRSVRVMGDNVVPFAEVPLLREVLCLLSAAGRKFEGDEHGQIPGLGITRITSLSLDDLNFDDRELLDIVHSFPKLEELHLSMCRLPGQSEKDHGHALNRATTPPLKVISFVFASPSDNFLHSLFPCVADVALRSMLFNYAQVSHSVVQSLVTRAGPSVEEFTFNWAAFGQAWELSVETPLDFSTNTSLRALTIGLPSHPRPAIWRPGIEHMLHTITSTRLASVTFGLQVAGMRADDAEQYREALGAVDLLGHESQFSQLKKDVLVVSGTPSTRDLIYWWDVLA